MIKNSSSVSGRLHKNYINVSTVAHAANYHVYGESGAEGVLLHSSRQ